MIAAAIEHVARCLNDRLDFELGHSDAIENVVVSDIRDTDGPVDPTATKGRLNVFVVNVEQDTLVKPRPPAADGGQMDLRPPAIFLNLYVMIAVDQTVEKSYRQALQLISRAVAFFQQNPIFDHQQTPGLDPGIERLTMQIENLDMRDLSSLWGVMGGKYRPSVLYKMRIIAFDSDDPKARVPVVVSSDLAAGQS